MKISSSSPSTISPLDSSSTDDVDGGQSMVDDVVNVLQQLTQQAQAQGQGSGDPASQDDLLQKLTDGVQQLQTSAADGSLSPEVKAQADQLLQALAQAAQQQQNTGYSKQDTFQPADASQATQGAHRKGGHHHHHHAAPVQGTDGDANTIQPDPTQS